MNKWLVTVKHEDGTESTQLYETESSDAETRDAVAKDLTDERGVKKYRDISVVAADPENLPPVHHSTDGN